MQLGAPALLAYFPTAHSVHATCPGVLNIPAMHVLHVPVGWLASFWYFPASHGTPLTFPAIQVLQLVVATADAPAKLVLPEVQAVHAV